MYVHRSGLIKTFQELRVTVTWALNLLMKFNEIVMYRRY